DLPVLRLHSDRGGEFSFDLLHDFCCGESILQSFTLPASPQENMVPEHCIGLIMEVARTSMIHAAAPHFLWPFAVRYAAHQLNFWPHVSLPETSPTLRWMGKDVTFDESVPFYRLFPYRSAPLPPPPPLFLAPGPPSDRPPSPLMVLLPQSGAASALVAELVEYAASLVAESESEFSPSVGGERALGTDVLEDKQEEFECLAAAVPHLGVEFFHTFSAILNMSTLRVLLHVVAQRNHELHSLDFSTAFLQGSLHEEIWLRRPPSFTGSFPAGTQWSLRRPVYGLRQAPNEWHDTQKTTLAALGFAPSTADPLPFLRTNTLLPLFYILVYVNDLVFAITDTEALALVKSELQKRHTCTDQGEHHLGLQVTRDRARLTITLTQSHMVHQVLQRVDFRYSSPLATPLATCHLLSAPPSDESVEPSGPYLEHVGCLILEHRTKHITLRYFLAEELQQRGQLCLAYATTRANTADIFTKAFQPDTCVLKACGGNGTCIKDSAGVASCVCDVGFVLQTNGRTCTDACMIKKCGGNAKCVKSAAGVASCVCEPGFVMQPDGTTCTDACALKACGGNGTCTKDSAGVASCVCDSGFVLQSDGRTCT
ncbi:unnamed protein product, partial [Closterium sp. NIES-54]